MIDHADVEVHLSSCTFALKNLPADDYTAVVEALVVIGRAAAVLSGLLRHLGTVGFLQYFGRVVTKSAAKIQPTKSC